MSLTASAGGRLRTLLIFNGLPSDLIGQVADAILTIQAEAREQGAQAERERLRALVESVPGMEMPQAGWDVFYRRDVLALLSDPEDPGDGGEQS